MLLNDISLRYQQRHFVVVCHLAPRRSLVYPAAQVASGQVGYAADCKSVYTGSIPVLASNTTFFQHYIPKLSVAALAKVWLWWGKMPSSNHITE